MVTMLLVQSLVIQNLLPEHVREICVRLLCLLLISNGRSHSLKGPLSCWISAQVLNQPLPLDSGDVIALFKNMSAECFRSAFWKLQDDQFETGKSSRRITHARCIFCTSVHIGCSHHCASDPYQRTRRQLAFAFGPSRRNKETKEADVADVADRNHVMDFSSTTL